MFVTLQYVSRFSVPEPWPSYFSWPPSFAPGIFGQISEIVRKCCTLIEIPGDVEILVNQPLRFQRVIFTGDFVVPVGGQIIIGSLWSCLGHLGAFWLPDFLRLRSSRVCGIFLPHLWRLGWSLKLDCKEFPRCQELPLTSRLIRLWDNEYNEYWIRLNIQPYDRNIPQESME